MQRTLTIVGGITAQLVSSLTGLDVYKQENIMLSVLTETT